MLKTMANSGRCLLVAGPPGVGKTTLIKKVFESLRQSHPYLKIKGFYTCEMREAGTRVGFEVVTLDGRRRILASAIYSSDSESFKWPIVGKYKVDVASFESLALPELQTLDEVDLFIIDEVGKMELYSSSFFPAVRNILDSNIPILASIPVPRFGRDIPGVSRLRNDPQAVVFTMNTSNRDAVKEEIYASLLNIFQLQ